MPSTELDTTSTVAKLAIRQLAAYNAHDLDAFCACYHAEVRVLKPSGEAVVVGNDALRSRYEGMFTAGNYGATVDQRMVLGRHCVEREHWWRRSPESGERMSGTVFVRYTARDGLIGTVVFFRPE